MASLSFPVPTMIWSSFLAPIVIMSGVPPGAKGLRPPWCCAEPSASSPVRPPAYTRSRVKNSPLAWPPPRLRPSTSEDLPPDTVRAWQELRHALETRRQQRTQRRRFRRAPAAYLGKLEAQLLQLILPP